MDGFATIRTGPLVLRAFLVLALLMAGRPALADSTMTVSDVNVDVTAKSAADAREQAIAQAQSRAFDRLVKRLVTDPADQAKIKPGQGEIEGMVQDFAVQSERTSAVRYIGVYTVRFRAGRVRKYLYDAGVASVGSVQEVMVLPVYQTGSGPVLWGPSNPWRSAWDRGGFGDNGPATLILPNGDPFDTGTLSASAAASGDMTALDAIMQRYHIAGVVVASAQPRGAGPASGLSITVTTYDGTGAKNTQSVTIDPQPGEPADKTLRRGVLMVAQALESQWQQTGGTGFVAYAPPPGMDQGPGQASAGAGALYPVSIPLGGIADWAVARERLAAIPGVGGVTLDALTRQGAAVTISFAGDPTALQAALAGSGYTLVQTGAVGAPAVPAPGPGPEGAVVAQPLAPPPPPPAEPEQAPEPVQPSEPVQPPEPEQPPAQ
jgi:hypothetical protein